MGYAKPLSTAMLERLVHWYLYKKAFPVTMEQLIDMADVMQEPFRCYDVKKDQEMRNLRAFIIAELYKRKHPPKQQQIVEV